MKLRHSLLSVVSLALAMAACDLASPDLPSNDFRRHQGMLQVAGGGAQMSDWQPGTCTADRHRAFVNYYLQHGYYYHQQMPDIDYRTYPFSVEQLFYDLTQHAVQEDIFSFVTSQQGRDDSAGGVQRERFGLSWLVNSSNELRISQVDSNGPAYEAGVRRGQQVVAISGIPVQVIEFDGYRLWQTSQLREAIDQNSMVLQIAGLAEPIEINRADFISQPLPVISKISNPHDGNKSLAYVQLNTFAQQDAELQLAKAALAVQQMQASDLLLDFRYNSGGSAHLANLLVSMIAGQDRLGSTSVRFQHNENLRAWDQEYRLQDQLAQPWPELEDLGIAVDRMPLLSGINRVYFLTSPNTCSAPEMAILALQGLDIETILVGGRTCGKPQFSYRFDNCTLSYAPIAGLYYNALNQTMTPGQGLPAQQQQQEDAKHDFTDPNEALLRHVLHHQAFGQFAPAAIAEGVQLQSQQGIKRQLGVSWYFEQPAMPITELSPP